MNINFELFFILGFLDKILSSAGGLFEKLLGGAAEGFGSSFGNSSGGQVLGTQDKSSIGMIGRGIGSFGGNAANMMGTEAISSLMRKTAKERGKAQRDYMNEAYPGTNPWEHLNAQGAGQGGTAGPTSKAREERNTAISLQHKNLATQKEVAEINADAIKYSADQSRGPKDDRLETDLALATAKANKINLETSEIIRMNDAIRHKLETEANLNEHQKELVYNKTYETLGNIFRITEETKKLGFEAQKAKVIAEMQKQLSEAQLWQIENSNPWRTLMSSVKGTKHEDELKAALVLLGPILIGGLSNRVRKFLPGASSMGNPKRFPTPKRRETDFMRREDKKKTGSFGDRKEFKSDLRTMKKWVPGKYMPKSTKKPWNKGMNKKQMEKYRNNLKKRR